MRRRGSKGLSYWVLALLMTYNSQSFAVLDRIGDDEPEKEASLQDNAKEPVWLVALKEFLPFVSGGGLIDKIFLNKSKPNDQVKRKDAEARLEKISNGVKQALGPVNEYVRTLTTWRRFANELDGVGSDSRLGSFKDSVIAMEDLIATADMISDSSVPQAVIRLESLYSTSFQEWERLWRIKGESDAVSTEIDSGMEETKQAFGRLGDGIRELKLNPRRKPADLRLGLKGLKYDVNTVHDKVNGLSSMWDAWNRRLGKEFLLYMTKFNVQPRKDVEDSNDRAASLDLRVLELERERAAISAQLETALEEVETTRAHLAATTSAANPRISGSAAATTTGMMGGTGDMHYGLVEELRGQVAEVDNLRSRQAERTSELNKTKTELQAIRSAGQTTVEEILVKLGR
jgi:hypothetical protein